MNGAPKSVGDVIAERIRRFRKAKGWSVAELAAACEARGAESLTQAVLTNIERPPGRSRGRRPVSVEELLTLADVLDVPPLSIVLPIGENVDVELVVGRPPVSVTAALTWLTGASSHGLDGKNPDDLSTWYALSRQRGNPR